MNDKTAADGLIQGKITDASVELMRRRIGFPNPALRVGLVDQPWNETVDAGGIRRFALCIGDDNPLYVDASYARASRWRRSMAPPGFEMTLGVPRLRAMDPAFAKETSGALKGVQLFHSGGENFYWSPLLEGDRLYKSHWVQDVHVKTSKFATRSAIVTNGLQWWDEQQRVRVSGVDWFVHAERKPVQPSQEEGEQQESKVKKHFPPRYTDEQLAEIETAYDNEYRRGAQRLFIEDVAVGETLPRMVKGPLTTTDLMNLHMGMGWLTYGNWPHRLAYENRKRLRGFYSKNEFGAWDTIQRVHWDLGLAHRVGVRSLYDIGPVRVVMLCHYLSNYAGDHAFVHRLKYEFREFNYMGDVTWIQGRVVDVGVDAQLGPRIELSLQGVNQRGLENIRGSATILCDSREQGSMRLPEPPVLTSYRASA